VTGGKRAVLALAGAAAMAGPVQAQGVMRPLYCLFTVDCAISALPDCAARTFSVEVAPIDHEAGLWFSYDGFALSVEDVTPSDTPMSYFLSAGYDEAVLLTVFDTGAALHLRQFSLPGSGPAQETARGQCEVL